MKLPILCSVLLLAACGKKIPETDYFPLQEGLQWQYEVNQISQEGEITRELTVTNRGKVKLKGKYEDETVYARRTSDGTDYFILHDDTGSYRIAKRTIVELTPRFDSSERKVLPSHIDIAVGSSWQAESKPYVLSVKSSHTLPNPRKKTLNMLYEVTALNESVEVYAGRFDNCVVVEATATIHIYADPKLGPVEVPITQTEWYAPGVGLVKMVREETLVSDYYGGGTLSFELLNFKH